jgi:hypothetical protein
VPEDVVLPFPERVASLRHVRSTLLLTSLRSIRDAGHFDPYIKALPREHHDALLNAVAGTWIEIAHAAAHYRACNALALSPERHRELGGHTFVRAKGTIFGTGIRWAQDAGITPWTVLPHFGRFWSRGFDGGGIQVVKVGPKDADIAVKECSLVDIAYFRNAMCGIVTGMLGLVCRQAHVRERPAGRPKAAACFRAQWA